MKFMIHQGIYDKLSIYSLYEQCFLPGQGFAAKFLKKKAPYRFFWIKNISTHSSPARKPANCDLNDWFIVRRELTIKISIR